MIADATFALLLALLWLAGLVLWIRTHLRFREVERGLGSTMRRLREIEEDESADQERATLPDLGTLSKMRSPFTRGR